MYELIEAIEAIHRQSHLRNETTSKLVYGYVVQEKEFPDGDLSSVAAVIGKKGLTEKAP